MNYAEELYANVLQQLNQKPMVKEFYSWLSPSKISISSVPRIGDQAPSSAQLSLPCGDSRAALVVFLRHCGCPFAERTMRDIRALADRNSQIHVIAISHSSPQETGKWLEGVGGAGSVNVIVDHERTLYASWGLGASDFWHVLNPWSLWDVYRLGKEKGIWNRPTETGNRWVRGGAWVVDGEGKVRWGGPSETASEEVDWEAGVKAAE